MSDIKHTPGIWKAEVFPNGAFVIEGRSGSVLCQRQSWETNADESRANGYLMAAAPDMLAALKALLPEGWGDDDTMDHMPGVKLARLAIAKAEGRS